MPPITSLQNQRVKDAVKLRERRGREKQQRIIIDGLREIQRAMDAGVRWAEVFVSEKTIDPSHASLIDALDQAGAEVLRVAPHVLDKIAFGDRVEGIVATAKTPQRSLEDVSLGDSPVVAVLEAIEKPGNVGAILRTADAAGIAAVVLADPATDLFNPNTIRASQGAVFSMPLASATGDQVRGWLAKQELPLFTAQVDGAVDFREAKIRPPCAIVLGSEAHGLTDGWQGEEVTSVRLPMLGSVDSLNVSTTAAVLFYAALQESTR